MSCKTIIKYCPVCGNLEFDESRESCQFCNAPLKDSKYTFDEWIKDDEANKKINEMAMSSPNYNEELAQKRENAMYLFGGSKTSATSSVQCPYCKSTNVSRLSTVGKVFSVGLLGLASNKVGKQWHCNSCNSNF